MPHLGRWVNIVGQRWRIGPEGGEALSSRHICRTIPFVHTYVRTSIRPYVCTSFRISQFRRWRRRSSWAAASTSRPCPSCHHCGWTCVNFETKLLKFGLHCGPTYVNSKTKKYFLKFCLLYSLGDLCQFWEKTFKIQFTL